MAHAAFIVAPVISRKAIQESAKWGSFCHKLRQSKSGRSFHHLRYLRRFIGLFIGQALAISLYLLRAYKMEKMNSDRSAGVIIMTSFSVLSMSDGYEVRFFPAIRKIDAEPDESPRRTCNKPNAKTPWA